MDRELISKILNNLRHNELLNNSINWHGIKIIRRDMFSSTVGFIFVNLFNSVCHSTSKYFTLAFFLFFCRNVTLRHALFFKLRQRIALKNPVQQAIHYVSIPCTEILNETKMSYTCEM